MRILEISKKHWQKFIKNQLITGSVIMFLGTNIHNAGQLLYHYLAINLLSKAHYGDLASLVSIFGLLSIVQQSISLAVIKFIAQEKNTTEANNLARWILIVSFWVSAAMAILILLLSPVISRFLQITQPLAVYLFAPVVFITFISNTGRAILQGFTKFTQFSVSMVVEVSIKIVSTLTLILLGYEIFGAIIGILIGAIIGVLMVWLYIKEKLKGKVNTVKNFIPLIKYFLPTLLQSIAVTGMLSTDIILVKHFFQPDAAGAYAALSKFGTIALFATSPITSVMFPLIAKKHSHGQPYHKIFYLSLSFVVGISSLVVILYFTFGTFITNILTKGKYINEAYLLWWFGLYMLLLGAAILFTQFYLSIGKTKTVWVFIAAAVLQVILILAFHPSLLSIIQDSIIASALLVGLLSLYFPYHDKIHI